MEDEREELWLDEGGDGAEGVAVAGDDAHVPATSSYDSTSKSGVPWPWVRWGPMGWEGGSHGHGGGWRGVLLGNVEVIGLEARGREAEEGVGEGEAER